MRILSGIGLATVLWLGLAGCSDEDDPAGDGSGSGAGSSGSGSGNLGPGSGSAGNGGSLNGPTSMGPDGTQFFGDFPVFPGAGTSEQAKPLENGMICDSVPLEIDLPEAVRQCFFDVDDPNQNNPAATLEQVLECVEEGNMVHVRLTFHPWFVDNTYGANQIGWVDEAAAAIDPMAMDPMAMMDMPKPPKGGKGGKGHTFDNLVGSDHAEIVIEDGNGETVLQFKLDYVSESADSASGYESLGVTGGEGEVIVGDASSVVQWMTSIDRNLNERGYGSYTTDSPETDELYSANPATPEWDYRVVYEAWIDTAVFGAAGFGGATIEFVHASPSKAESNTIVVEPGDCPPPPCREGDVNPECNYTGGTGGGGGVGGHGGSEGPCVDNDPDSMECTDAGRPDSGTPADSGFPDLPPPR